jgi:hypothetical protein
MGHAAAAGIPDFSTMLGWQLAQAHSHLAKYEAGRTS